MDVKPAQPGPSSLHAITPSAGSHVSITKILVSNSACEIVLNDGARYTSLLSIRMRTCNREDLCSTASQVLKMYEVVVAGVKL